MREGKGFLPGVDSPQGMGVGLPRRKEGGVALT